MDGHMRAWIALAAALVCGGWTSSGNIEGIGGTFTANGTLGTVPADAMLVGCRFKETANHTVLVSLGTGAGGAQVLAAVSVGALLEVPINGPSMLLQAWTADQSIFVASAAWNSASINATCWYVR